ncbi:MAG: hypothetical protein IJ865_00150 [Clostridia bacterium]|nr:hypothetical protein [Clostridia bacterium]
MAYPSAKPMHISLKMLPRMSPGQAGTGMRKENAKIMLEVRLPNAKKGYNNSDTFIYKGSNAA